MKKAGQKSKFDWFEQLNSALLLYANGILEDSDEAKEVVKEVFFIFFGEEDPVSFPKPWLYKKTRELSVSRLNQKKKSSIQDHRQLEFFPESKIEKQIDSIERVRKEDKIVRVKHEAWFLPEKSRNLLRMKFEQKLSNQEIADQQNISLEKVSLDLHHLILDLWFEWKEENIL